MKVAVLASEGEHVIGRIFMLVSSSNCVVMVSQKLLEGRRKKCCDVGE